MVHLESSNRSLSIGIKFKYPIGATPKRAVFLVLDPHHVVFVTGDLRHVRTRHCRTARGKAVKTVAGLMSLGRGWPSGCQEVVKG